MSSKERYASQSRRDFLATAGIGALTLGMTSTVTAPAFAALPVPMTAPAPPRLQPFDMADVQLGEGPFLHAQQMTEAYLLRLQPDRMLHNFRLNAGLKPKAPVYGGWEAEQSLAKKIRASEPRLEFTIVAPRVER